MLRNKLFHAFLYFNAINISYSFLTGEMNADEHRHIYILDDEANEKFNFVSNYISTAKYTKLNFLPKYLLQEFSDYAYIFFAVVIIIQQIENLAPTSRVATLNPLLLMLVIAAFLELYQDRNRKENDKQENLATVNVFVENHFEQRLSKDIKCGDILLIEDGDVVRADVYILTTSEKNATCYIQTANIDGETNLKMRAAFSDTEYNPALLSSLHGEVHIELPSPRIEAMNGQVRLHGVDYVCGMNNSIIRGCKLVNTDWVYGIVVYTGNDTKMQQNSLQVPLKRTKMDNLRNQHIVYILFFLILIAILCVAGRVLYQRRYPHFTFDSERGIIWMFFRYLLLLEAMFPISILVAIDFIKYHLSRFIDLDLEMYDEETGQAAHSNSYSIVDELGQIDVIFSDKTGTLTRNVMELVRVISNQQVFVKNSDIGFRDLVPDENTPDEFLDLLRCMLLCHTVLPEKRSTGKLKYSGSSPDEVSILEGLLEMKCCVEERTMSSMTINLNGRIEKYKIIDFIDFSSSRKRMSVIVESPKGDVLLFCKGAETVIKERLKSLGSSFVHALREMNTCSLTGLRVLCFAKKIFPNYDTWKLEYNGLTDEKSKSSVEDKAECNLEFLGSSAIEDQLQEGVSDTIKLIRQAGIRLWVLTGDRKETAISIARSCHIIQPSDSIVVLNGNSLSKAQEAITKAINEVQKREGSYALVINGSTLTHVLCDELCGEFYNLAKDCKTVLCCRVSPKQKSKVVQLVKDLSKMRTLAIGDGANDVSMIRTAHIGIGINGKEGTQAARFADISIGKFRFLAKLLLVHGGWGYQRLGKTILYFLYKNWILYMCQLWYSPMSMFSGQTLFETWIMVFYNFMFTALPPVIMGLHEKHLSKEMLLQFPELYKLGSTDTAYNFKKLALCFLNACYHSILIIVICGYFVWTSEPLVDGHFSSGLWAFSTMVYSVCIITAILKCALVNRF